MQEAPSVRRPVGHITDPIRRLSIWRDRRQGITDRPELDEAISYLDRFSGNPREKARCRSCGTPLFREA